jgi:serine/threonine-protein kinase
LSQLKICPVCNTEYPANERFCPRDGTALRAQSAAANDLVGAVIAERYHVLKKLGEGGMGQVYLAEHVKMGRKSAVKVMHPGMVQNVDAISRFNREAANASRINHPNVAGIYDFGETAEGLIYLAMEFVEGQPLTDVIKQHGALPPMRASEIARQTAEGLSVAHDMGIVHRDLKPDNIMIAKGRAGADLVKVVDFGIAKAAASEEQKVTKTGMVVGTPEYMSPEQLSGDPLDARSDIYALALVTFNMLTGKLPFPGETMQESMIMRLTDEPRSLVDMKADVQWPSDLQAVLDKALARNANDRYRNASEFAHDLVQAIDRMPATSITTMGTEVLQRISRASAAKGPSADMATAATVQVGVPKTRIANKGEVVGRTAEELSDRHVSRNQSPATTPTKSKTGMYAGLAAVGLAVIGLGGYLYLSPSKGVDNPVANNSASPSPITAPTAGEDSSKPVASSGVPATPSAPVEQLSARIVNVPESLKVFNRFLEVSRDSASAARLLERLSGVDLTTSVQRADAALLVYKARLNMNDAEGACEALRDAVGTAPAAQKAQIEERLKGCG